LEEIAEKLGAEEKQPLYASDISQKSRCVKVPTVKWSQISPVGWILCLSREQML